MDNCLYVYEIWYLQTFVRVFVTFCDAFNFTKGKSCLNTPYIHMYINYKIFKQTLVQHLHICVDLQCTNRLLNI